MMFAQRASPTGPIRYLILFTHIIAGVLTAGVIVGFGQLYPMLTAAGVYHSYCEGVVSSNDICEKQAQMLSNMFNYGATVSIFIQSPSGVLLDVAGPRLTALLGLILMVPGSLMFAFSTAHLDMYVSGFCLISAGGPMVFVSIMSTANLFPKFSSVVLTMMNGAYGGGAMVFWVFNVLYFHHGISLKTLFIAYTVLCGALAIIVAFTWPFRKYTEIPSDKPISPEMPVRVGESRFRAILRQMFNLHYLWLVLMTGTLVLKSNFYLSTSDTQLAYMSNDPHKLDLYGEIFGLMLPLVGFAVAPVGLVTDKLGLLPGAFFLIFSSTIPSITGMIWNLKLQIVTFITFSVYYPYIYGYWSTFLVFMFGFDNYGFLYAGVALAAGCINLIGTVLIAKATTAHHFFVINLALEIATAAFLVYPIAMLIYKFATRGSSGEKERLINESYDYRSSGGGRY